MPTLRNVCDYTKEAKRLRKSGSFEEAMSLLDEAEIKFNCNERIWCCRGGIFKACGRYEEAHRCFNVALQINPKSEVAMTAKGHAYLAEGNLMAARQWFEAVLQMNPNNEVAMTAKGQVFLAGGEVLAARGCFDAALQIDGGNEVAMNMRGQTFLAEGDAVKARECFDYTLQHLYQRNEIAMNARGQTFVLEGKMIEAHSCFDYTLEHLNPRNDMAMTAKGQAFLAEGDVELARQWLDRALQINPDNAVAVYFSARILLQQGKKTEAKNLLIVRLQQPRVSFAILMLFALCTSPDDALWTAMSTVLGEEVIAEVKRVYDDNSLLVEAELSLLITEPLMN